MKRIFIALVAVIIILPGVAQERKINIDSNWKYQYGSHKEAIAPDFDDSAWRTLDLPHDWSVETDAATAAGNNIGPFSKNSTEGSASGQTVGGEGWYRKTFTLSEEDLKGKVSLYFEGAYYHTYIYLNGRHIYFNPYGYSSFRFDITDHVLPAGEENTLSVCVKNEGKNTRWYAGSGIYRHVWLIKTPALHLDDWSTNIEAISEDVKVSSLILNESGENKTATFTAEIYDSENKLVTTKSLETTVNSGKEEPVVLNIQISDAKRWSPETPNLYKAVLSVSDGETTDRYSTKFGIRTIEFSAEKGFLLNGVPTLLRGGCVHHDNGLLGAASFDRAEERRLQILKNNGFNAVRCSHNIPSEHFLYACDSIGLMVIDEAFDHWLVAKNPNDYHNFFTEFSNRDLQVMLRRDRNHPSIIMWSIGNEVPGRIEPEGMAAAERLRKMVKKYDTTRPVTAAICDWDTPWHPWEDETAKAFNSLDVGGYNYLYNKYESDHSKYPNRIMYGAESYAKHASQNWDLVEKHPYVIGDFIWTAMDYVGEAGIGSASIRKSGNQSQFQDWPWFNGWCGDIDLIGQKKPQSYYRDVVWRIAPITMGVERPIPSGYYQSISNWGWQLEQQSWTFNDLTEKDIMTVNVYSRAPRVRLYLNDELLDEKATSNTYWAGFYIPYRPGVLKAVEFDGTKEGAYFILETTSADAAIRLTADRKEIRSNNTDLSYVTIELIDEKGRVITSNSERKINITVEGEGSLLAAGNASPTDMESFRSETPKLYNGRALAIIKSSDTEGEIKLKVTSEGLADAVITIKTGKNIQEGSAIAEQKNDEDIAYNIHDGQLTVFGTNNYNLFNIAGSLLPKGQVLNKGLYILKAGTTIKKILVK
ncbi:MAG: DUF4982 domain-containing protein [Paraprevotella sp.]|nr:DUF4982 domain-containing protein [Paraprevotella sp.]